MIKTALISLGLMMASTVGLAPQNAPTNTSSTFSIETSTVQEDLACFYHNQYPVNTLSYLVPNTKNGDLYNDFKLLTMYANQGDLYLYFYAESTFTFDKVELEYSTSTVLSEDQTSVVEDWKSGEDRFSFRVHDYNGSRKKFYKCVAKDFYDYNVGDLHRVKAGRIYCSQGDEFHTMIRNCEESEYSWKDQKAGEDQVYTYYKNNYLLVNQSKYVQQFIKTKYEDISQTTALEAREINWLFFTYDYSSLGVNYSLGKLKEIAIDYEYMNYTNTYRVNGNNNSTVYTGALNYPNSFFDGLGHSAREAEFKVTKTQRLETVVTPSTRTIDTVTDSGTIFFFWNITHRVKYTYNTIQGLDDASISSIEDKGFKGFLEKTRDIYKWAVDFREDDRYLVKTENSWNNFWDFLNSTVKVTSTCHQAASVVATRFVFENQDGTAELNAIMNPVEISQIASTTPTTYTTVSFSLGSEKATRNFFVIIGIIGGILLLVGIIWLIIKLRPLFPRRARKEVTMANTNKKAYRKNNYKPRKNKKRR